MKRERITITIDSELIPAIDAIVDGQAIRNRSHALEVTARRGLALTELGAIFFIYRNTFSTNEAFTATLASLEARRWYCIAPTDQAGNASLWLESMAGQVTSTPERQVIPADFGTAAAILLHKDQLPPHFLIIDLAGNKIPSDLLAGYVRHTAGQHLLTSFLTGDGLSYAATGWHLAARSLTEHIPAGFSSLETDVFPTLAKAGRINTYVTGT